MKFPTIGSVIPSNATQKGGYRDNWAAEGRFCDFSLFPLTTKSSPLAIFGNPEHTGNKSGEDSKTTP